MYITPFFKAASNATSTAFTAKIPVATKPSGDRVFDLGVAPYSVARILPAFALLLPVCTGGNNKTFDMRLWGWNLLSDDSCWVPYLICDLSVVAGNMDAAAAGAGLFLPDTLTVNKGVATATGAWDTVLSTTNDTPAHVAFHLLGAHLIEFDYDADAGASASTADNCLFKLFDF
jgi:hypothetical protein